MRDDKRGAIKPGSQRMLDRLNISLKNWLKVTNEYKLIFKGPEGTLEALSLYN